jgi:hypothetical protein
MTDQYSFDPDDAVNATITIRIRFNNDEHGRFQLRLAELFK